MLIVEDDEEILTGWEAIFSQRGWAVATAGTVAEGLALLEPVPDFLILDLSLPDGGGEEILHRVREADLKTRVAVTTAVSNPARLRVVRGLKPEVVFLKPIDVVGVWWEGELARAG